MARNIGATLSLKEGNFFANIKSAVSATEGLKKSLGGTEKSISSFGNGLKSIGTKALGAATVIGGALATAGVAAVKLGDDYKSALNDISAQTGTTGTELSAFDGILKDIYSKNYGESFSDIADAISTVTQSSKTLNPSGIKQMTTDAIALRDTFGYDIQESVRAANMLIDQFGVSGTEAFNLIAQGAQQGLDKNGDLLDSINEYSVHFRQIGIDAEGMFNSLLNGTASGTFSVDKLGDAVKEFGIRVKDGTGDEAFKALGLSVDATKQAFVAGGAAGAQAFKSVTDALFSMDDKVKQNQLGVQLFGTMWEDLGAEGIKALSDINGEFDRTYDAMQQINEVKYDNLGSALGGLKRLLITNVALPISNELTPTVSNFVNSLRNAFSDGSLTSAISGLTSGVVSAIGGISDVAGTVFSAISTAISNNRPAIDGVITAFGNLKNSISNAFSGEGVNLIQTLASATVPALASALSLAANTASTVVDAVSFLSPVIAGVAAAMTAYKIAVTAANVVDTVRNGLIAFIAAAQGVQTASLAGLTTATIVQTAATTALGAAMSFITSPIGIVVIAIGAVVAAGVALYKNWDWIKNMAINLWNGIKNVFSGIKDTISNAWNGVKETASNAWNGIKDTISEKLNNIKSAYDEHGGGLKGAVAGVVEGIKG